MKQPTRICPYCAETILRAAIKCRYCLSELEPLEQAPSLGPPDTRVGIGYAEDDPRVQTLADHRRKRLLAGFKNVGKYVEVREILGGDHEGLIEAISEDWDYGMGTKLHPMFLIRFPDNTLDWKNAISLFFRSTNEAWLAERDGGAS